MSDFDFFVDQARQMLDKLEDELSASKMLGDNKRLDLLDQISSQIASVQGDVAQAQTQIPILTPDEQQEASQTIREITNRIVAIQAEVKIDKEQTLRNNDQPEQGIAQGQLTDMNKVQIAAVMYEDAKVNLNDADRALDEVVTLNSEITNVLQRDLETLNRVNNELTGIQADSKLAKKQLRKLAMHVTSNKCYTAMFFVVVLVIIGLSIWDIVKSTKKSQNSE